MFKAELARFDNLPVLVYVFPDNSVKYEFENRTIYNDDQIRMEIEQIIEGKKENN
jgi:hypothetical protein